jgi:hypothetical protein
LNVYLQSSDASGAGKGAKVRSFSSLPRGRKTWHDVLTVGDFEQLGANGCAKITLDITSNHEGGCDSKICALRLFAKPAPASLGVRWGPFPPAAASLAHHVAVFGGDCSGDGEKEVSKERYFVGEAWGDPSTRFSVHVSAQCRASGEGDNKNGRFTLAGDWPQGNRNGRLTLTLTNSLGHWPMQLTWDPDSGILRGTAKRDQGAAAPTILVSFSAVKRSAYDALDGKRFRMTNKIGEHGHRVRRAPNFSAEHVATIEWGKLPEDCVTVAAEVDGWLRLHPSMDSALRASHGYVAHDPATEAWTVLEYQGNKMFEEVAPINAAELKSPKKGESLPAGASAYEAAHFMLQIWPKGCTTSTRPKQQPAYSGGGGGGGSGSGGRRLGASVAATTVVPGDFDSRATSCASFGFFQGQSVRSARFPEWGVGFVIGVAEGSLWINWEGDVGATTRADHWTRALLYPCAPAPLPSVSAAAAAAARSTDPQSRTKTLPPVGTAVPRKIGSLPHEGPVLVLIGTPVAFDGAVFAIEAPDAAPFLAGAFQV